MTKVIAFLLCVLLTSTAFSQFESNHAIWQRVEALNKAVFETKDSAAIHELTSERMTYGHSGGNIEDKRTMLRNAVANTEVYSNITQERLSTLSVGNTLIIRYILRATGVKNGTSSPLNLSILQVWAKEHGKWRLFARQAVKVAPK